VIDRGCAAKVVAIPVYITRRPIFYSLGMIIPGPRFLFIIQEVCMSKITELVDELVTPILDDMSLELVDVEYVKEGSNWFLRVFVDKDSGVDIEECGIVSERLSEKLDELDPITHNYFLEVSSPGAERPLKKERDFEKAIGKNVLVKTYEPINGEKAIEGKLLSYNGDSLSIEMTIKTRKKQVDIPMEKVAKARLAVTFS
jgi:ribosome maturation factor RimP